MAILTIIGGLCVGLCLVMGAMWFLNNIELKNEGKKNDD